MAKCERWKLPTPICKIPGWVFARSYFGMLTPISDAAERMSLESDGIFLFFASGSLPLAGEAMFCDFEDEVAKKILQVDIAKVQTLDFLKAQKL